MTTQEIIEMFDEYVIGNYGRLPKAVVKGDGSYFYDADGNKVLDMFPGWAVSGIGHCHRKVVEAIRKHAQEGKARKIKEISRQYKIRSDAGQLLGTIKEWDSGRVVLDVQVNDRGAREALVETLKARFGLEKTAS